MLQVVEPATAYRPAADLGIVTCYFNPGGFKSKRVNYDSFMQPIRAGGLDVITVECAFGEARFELEPGADVVQLCSPSIMFQKERLLNLALARLPERCTKVAWLDCDVLFDDPDWPGATSRALDAHCIVQPFATAFRLPPRQRQYTGDGAGWRSFAAVFRESPRLFLTGNFDAHGHTGFAWAARRDLLRAHGLYDGMVACCADHIIAHAALGDWSSACFRRLAGVNNPYATDIRAWCRRFYADVQGNLGVVHANLLHLWHGSMARRRYVECAKQLLGFAYDPKTDLRLGAAGTWEWASAKPELHAWVKEYFAQRNEDDQDGEGEQAPALP
ncbi:MAG: hypothetical protein HY903_11625 [Deltaproteobacteria bacterium]|nr:hypothetical protein [Deltaproteobacteria bacterium]